MVASWFAKASKDLRLAKAVFDYGEDFLEASGFHSQQCAEKSIKGFLTLHKIPFRKTHDIKELLKSVAALDIELAKLLKPAINLTNYAVAYRYPDASDIEEVTKEKATQAAKIAEQVYQELSRRIQQ
jgi:HEPN domain-containing protein